MTSPRRLLLATALAALGALGAATPARAQSTLGFEDLAYAGPMRWAGGDLLDSYAGFQWTGLRPLDLTNYQPSDAFTGGLLASGYPRGTSEFGNVLAIAYGEVTMTGASPFVLHGGTFGSGWTDPVPFRVLGTLAGATVLDRTLTLRATGDGAAPAPLPLAFDFGAVLVDRIVFTPDFGAPSSDPYGSDAQNLGQGRYMSVYADNLRVATVPEPATVALLAGGLVILGAGARRRRPRTTA